MLEEINTAKTRTPAWVNNYRSKVIPASEAVKVIKSGMNVIVQPGCAVPQALVKALVDRKDELENVNIYHILTVGPAPYVQPGMEKHFRHVAFFVGHNTRKAINEGRADFVPIYLFEVPLLFKRGIIPVDVALIHVTPPDEHGFCSYGIDVGTIKTPAEKAKVIIAQVNKKCRELLEILLFILIKLIILSNKTTICKNCRRWEPIRRLKSLRLLKKLAIISQI
jgi:acyl-CoA hydrolase